MSYAKGEGSKDAEYAKGGGQLGRTRDFLKESDGKDQNVVKRSGENAYKNPNLKEENYSKGSKDPGAKRTGDKALTTVKPRT